MLALRLTRSAHPAVQLRRLMVAAASAGTGFLLLCALGHALSHPDTPGASALRLAWCAVPLAATAHLAVAVARTDPGTRPRPGLAAIGLGPGRLMAISATTTALATALGSLLALLVFLHLRGDLTGMPFDGAAAPALAADTPLPLPATLTLLTLLPLTASTSVALTLRPRDSRTRTTPPAKPGTPIPRITLTRRPQKDSIRGRAARGTTQPTQPAGSRAAGAMGVPPLERSRERGRVGAGGNRPAPDSDTPPPGTPHPARTTGIPPLMLSRGGHAKSGATDIPPTSTLSHGTPQTPDAQSTPRPSSTAPTDDALPTPTPPNPTALPWGAALLAAGLAVEAYAARTTTTATGGTDLTLPGGPTGPATVLAGWALTVLGLALAGPGLTHLCGRLLQAARPGALRLLAGRGLMQEASRIGRPLGILCAVVSGVYTMSALHDAIDPADPASLAFGGPLATLGTALVAGCALATLLTTAVEARQARADTTAALLRLGAPSTALRSAAALRAGALAALFVPLTLTVAELASLPLTG
ncbi:hypothetical protein [Streptomyces sp. NPDC002328]|uniref:hypothetical protein n=1 Tax=Streptomyces sp. NPDC002328 TaxID=3364642 RepID=UPI003685CABC